MPCQFTTNVRYGEERPEGLENFEGVDIGPFTLWPNECCGLITVSGFRTPNEDEEDFDPDFDDADMWMQEAYDDFDFINKESKFDFGAWSQTFDDPQPFTMMAILVDKQLPCWNEELRRHGWFKTCSFYNPNTGNMCHQFMKTLENRGKYYVPEAI